MRREHLSGSDVSMLELARSCQAGERADRPHDRCSTSAGRITHEAVMEVGRHVSVTSEGGVVVEHSIVYLFIRMESQDQNQNAR